MDLKSLQWHEPTLKRFGIRTSMLAKIHSSAEELGRVEGGKLAGVPITGVDLLQGLHEQGTSGKPKALIRGTRIRHVRCLLA